MPTSDACVAAADVLLLLQLPGVRSVVVNLLTHGAAVTLDASGASGVRDVIDAITDAGVWGACESVWRSIGLLRTQGT